MEASDREDISLHFRQAGIKSLGWIQLLLRNDKIAEGPRLIIAHLIAPLGLGLCADVQLPSRCCIITTRYMRLYVKRNKMTGKWATSGVCSFLLFQNGHHCGLHPAWFIHEHASSWSNPHSYPSAKAPHTPNNIITSLVHNHTPYLEVHSHFAVSPETTVNSHYALPLSVASSGLT